MSRPFVAYYRVSTQKQGRSGLGLEAQRTMIAECVARLGGAIVGAFEEVESGKHHENRPELRKALALARRCRATLIVAKLDRLARNVAFVSALLDTPGVEFKAADFPDASRMMLQLLAVFAEYEREMISKRTKEALAARRARGLSLGNPTNLQAAAFDVAGHNRAKARAEAERLRPVIDGLRREGVTTVRAICAALNEKGYVTERGGSWHRSGVGRVLRRLG
ncbi:MAG: recombinase family protein [Tepidisphaeraceae bacterium]